MTRRVVCGCDSLLAWTLRLWASFQRSGNVANPTTPLVQSSMLPTFVFVLDNFKARGELVSSSSSLCVYI